MNKNHVFEQLSSYMDNQLSEQEKQKVEEHLRSCSLCSQELARLKLISDKLKAWQVPDLGPFFEQAVKEEIARPGLERGEVKMKRKTLAILVPSSAVVAILLIVFLGGLINVYTKKGVHGRFRGSSDEMGRHYAPKSFHGLSEMSYKSVDYNVARERTLPPRGQYEAWGVSPRVGRQPVTETAKLDTYHQNQTISSAEGSVIVIQPVLPATGEGEKIIRTAEIKLEVEDGKIAYKKASEICQELGGYLAASRFYKDREGRESGSITMRIPKDKFLTALDRLSALGKLEDSSSNSQDISQEYANIKAQLDATMVVYNKMLEALQKRQTTIPEAMRLESELTPVLQRIEGLKNRLEYLNNAVSFTTITVNFHEARISNKVLKESRRYIQESIIAAKINAVKFFANALPVIIVLVVWLVVILVAVLTIAFLIKYLIRRVFKR